MKTKEYREQIDQTFLDLLEEKQLDWKKEWSGNGTQSPYNANSGHRYKGINRFYLSLIAMSRGYQEPRWATFYQIKERGWRLNNAKGQGVKVEYWFPYDTEEKKMVSWQKFRESWEKFGERYLLRVQYSTVFNADLIEGIPALPKPEKRQIEPDQLITTLSKNMGVEILHDGGNRAFYRPSEDKIHLPIPESFYSEYAYGSTALHELGHATGAPHRLNRDMSGHFGSQAYAYEELIAEISSCFMSANLRMEQQEGHIKNHKAYVQSWIGQIKEKPETLIKAVQQAEKAAAYMEYQAELLPESEYKAISQATMEVTEDKIGKEIRPELQDRKILHNTIKEIHADLKELKEGTVFFRKVIGEYGLSRIATKEREVIEIVKAYEESIGRKESVVEKYDTEQLKDYAQKCKQYLLFGEAVDKWGQGELHSREAIKICDTPDLLLKAGCQPLPMHITQRHLKNCMTPEVQEHKQYHGLSMEEIKKLPEALEHPAMIMESSTRKDSLVVVLDYKDKKGLPVILTFVLEGSAFYQRKHRKSNFVTSVYGKNDFQGFFERALDGNQLIYIDKQKSQEFALLPLHLRQDHPALDFDTIIKPDHAAVKNNLEMRKETQKVVNALSKSFMKPKL